MPSAIPAEAGRPAHPAVGVGNLSRLVRPAGRSALPSRPKAFADIRQPGPLPKLSHHADGPSLFASSSGSSKSRKKLQLPEAQRKRHPNAFLSVEPEIFYMIRRLVEMPELGVTVGLRRLRRTMRPPGRIPPFALAEILSGSFIVTGCNDGSVKR